MWVQWEECGELLVGPFNGLFPGHMKLEPDTRPVDTEAPATHSCAHDYMLAHSCAYGLSIRWIEHTRFVSVL